MNLDSQTIFLLGSTLSDELAGSFLKSFLFQLTGFLIVVSALTILWGTISLVGYVFSLFPSTRPTDTSISAAVPTEHVAAIAAALHTVIRGPYRITKIERAPRKSPQGQP